MVRGRALVPVVLGRGCLLLPNGFGCQLQSHLFIPMVPTGRMGILRLGEVPCLGSWKRWLVREEREDSRLPLDTTHKNKSLHVRYPRRRIIPTTSQLCDFHVMENTLIGSFTVHHSQTCDTGVTSRAQLKANCPGTRRTWGHFLAWLSRLRIQKCSDIFLGHGHGSDLALLSFDFL